MVLTGYKLLAASLISAVVAGTSAPVFGQRAEKACPKLDLVFPGGPVSVESETDLVLRIEGGFDPRKNSIEWKASSGKILKGQGSQILTLRAEEDDEGTSIRIVVELSGLASECKDDVSGLLVIEQLPIGEPVDTFGKVGNSKGSQDLFLNKLDVYLMELQNYPTHEGIVKIDFETRTSRRHKIDHLRRIIDHFNFRKFDLKRITFAFSEGSEFESTSLWRAAHDALLKRFYRGYTVVKAEEFNAKSAGLFNNK